MKKRILAMLLSAMLVANISACNDAYSDNTENTTEYTTALTTERDTTDVSQDVVSDSPSNLSIYSNYSDILNDYKNLLIYRQEHDIYIEGIPYPYDGEPTEIWNALVFCTEETLVKNAGYCIKDINNDKISELILINKSYKINAVFTTVNGLPKLLDTYGIGNQSVAIDESGNIYQSGYGKGENWYACVQQISVDGSLNLIQYGCYDPNIDGNFDPLDLEYFQVQNGERTVINEEQLNELKGKYAIFYHDTVETIRGAGIEPTLMFE